VNYKREVGYPKSILSYRRPSNLNDGNDQGFHPTQKPVALMKYLIETYTNEGDLVVDPFIGSGTLAVACIETNRRFIGIELSSDYCEIARRRVDDAGRQQRMNFNPSPIDKHNKGC
jgi:DNA modification methylase